MDFNELESVCSLNDWKLYQDYLSTYDWSNYTYDFYRKDRRYFYWKEYHNDDQLKFLDPLDLKLACLRAFYFEQYDERFDEYRKHRNRDKSKGRRLKERINNMLSDTNCQFLTITFTDDDLMLSKDTRKRYVKEFLKNQCFSYVANIDYGSKNGREHYHAVVVPKYDQINYLDRKTKGNINAIHIYSQNALQLAHYLVKLTNHAIKDSTKGERTIYSRAPKK